MADPELERAIESLAAELAPALIERARADAADEARLVLTRRLAEAFVRHCEAELVGPRKATTEPEPEPQPEPQVVHEPEPEPESHPLAERAREDAQGSYVYGVAAVGTELPAELGGVDPARPVHLVESHGLTAIVSAVSLTEFGEETLREKLNDVGWLEETARAHENVLEATLEETAVVPLRLCTVFTDDGQVREMLARERGVLLDALDRLAGKAEWGVKAFAAVAALEREVDARGGGAEEDRAVSAGTAYMNRKRREAHSREQVEEVADEWARLIHDRLSEVAAEALLNPLQRPEVSGHDGEMLLNGVYLLAAEKVSDFRDLLVELRDDLDRKGVEIVLTGPWPAYNFVKSSIEAAR